VELRALRPQEWLLKPVRHAATVQARRAADDAAVAVAAAFVAVEAARAEAERLARLNPYYGFE
jgi:hypothetical protein